MRIDVAGSDNANGIVRKIVFKRVPHCSDLMLSRGIDTAEDSANPNSACRTRSSMRGRFRAGDVDRCARWFPDRDLGEHRTTVRLSRSAPR